MPPSKHKFVIIMLLADGLMQAQRMCSLGWTDFLKVEMRDGRKTLVVSYWMSGLPFS